MSVNSDKRNKITIFDLCVLYNNDKHTIKQIEDVLIECALINDFDITLDAVETEDIQMDDINDHVWERCDICGRRTHPNELRLYKGICADCANPKP